MIGILGLQFSGDWSASAQMKAQIEYMLTGAWTLDDSGQALKKLIMSFLPPVADSINGGFPSTMPQERIFSFTIVFNQGERDVDIHFMRFDHFVRLSDDGVPLIAAYPKRKEGGER